MIKNIIASTILVSSLNAITFKEAMQTEKEFGVLEALGTYKSLVEQNNVHAMFRLAKIYSSGKEIKRSLSKSKKLLEKASSLNHHKSTYYLGKLYLSKKSPYYDLTTAFNTFAKAANENYAPAQNMVGQFFVNGIVVDKDYKKAVSLFEKASKQGLTDAQCNLSFMYASGKGVFPNFGRAHTFAKDGVLKKNKKCLKVWKDYKLFKYKEDKSWKFNFYTKP
jgi:TPR repeat protein